MNNTIPLDRLDRQDEINKKISHASAVAWLMGQEQEQYNFHQMSMAAWLLQDMLEDIRSLALHEDAPVPAD